MSFNFSFNQLRTFVTVAREGNLTRAADILCLSQPAVSGQIKLFEDELGLKLFERNSRGMVLTERGRALLEMAEQAISAARQVKVRAETLRDDLMGELRIGTVAAPAILQLGQTFCGLTASHPSLQVSMLQGISGEVLEWINCGRIDVGYVIGKPQDTRIAFIELAPVTLRVVAPASWASKISRLDWAGVAALPWISTPSKCSFNKLATRMFARHNVQPQTIVAADQEHTLRSLVASGVGLTLLREDVALVAQDAGEVVFWPPGVEFSHLYFVYNEDKENSPIHQAVLNVVRQLWKV